MSLINRMLNDLDERRAVPGDALRFQRDVRPLPQPRRAVWPWLLGSGVLVGTAIAGTWVFLMHGPGRALPALPAPLTKEAVNAGLPSLVTTVESVPPKTQDVANVLSAGGALHPVAEPQLRLSTDVSPLPVQRRENVKPAATAKPLAVAPSPASPPASAEVADGLGRIDKQTIEASPQERAERLYRSALGLLTQGRNDEGLTTIRAALHEDPGHIAARQWLIKHYIDSRSFDAAQGVLQDGLAALPKQAAWALLLSRLQAERGDNAGALKTLENAQQQAPATPELEGAVGAVLQRLGRHAEAEQHFANATRIEPAKARWWLGLALAHEAQGKTADARTAFQHAAGLRNLAPDLQVFVEQKLN
jgi:MSHA biogenesis protein MshN